MSPVAVSGLLHPAFNTTVFRADCRLTIGLCLLLGTLNTTTGVVPWPANLFYNLELHHVSAPLGALVLAAAVLLAGLRPGAGAASP